MISKIISAQYAQAVNFTQTQPPPNNILTATGTTIGPDTVTISNEGKSALIASKLQPPGKGSNTISSIEDDLSNLTSFVENKIQSLYKELGIPSNAQMNIYSGTDGKIIVDGKNPLSEQLAEAINADDTLSNAIRGVASSTFLLEAVKKQQEFAAAYDKDPVAAVERFGYLLEDGHSYHITLAMQNNHLDTKVDYI
ncbi:MAG: hypothetical protein OEM02_11255 [Desulfobulbaceae bacterium]|nr:hypothetical protein [Desulfobulbaceae bacterium]